MLSIIVAMDSKRGIGKDNKLLWHIPEDLKRFKQITNGHPIIMGRKTYESIGRLLPNRTNIIVTRDKQYVISGAVIVHSLEEGIKTAKNVILGIQSEAWRTPESELKRSWTSQDDNKKKEDEVFIIGGGQIFQQALPMVDKLYLTIVDGDFNADTFFPEYEATFTRKTFEQKGESGEYKYTFLDLEK